MADSDLALSTANFMGVMFELCVAVAIFVYLKSKRGIREFNETIKHPDNEQITTIAKWLQKRSKVLRGLADDGAHVGGPYPGFWTGVALMLYPSY